MRPHIQHKQKHLIPSVHSGHTLRGGPCYLPGLYLDHTVPLSSRGYSNRCRWCGHRWSCWDSHISGGSHSHMFPRGILGRKWSHSISQVLGAHTYQGCLLRCVLWVLSMGSCLGRPVPPEVWEAQLWSSSHGGVHSPAAQDLSREHYGSAPNTFACWMPTALLHG